MKYFRGFVAILLFMAAPSFAQDSLNVRRIGQMTASGQAVAVEVRDTFAYVADGTDGLRVLNISNPSQPYEVSYYDTPGSAREVTLVGDFAFIADRPNGVRVINVSNPLSPYEVGYIDTPGSAESIAISDGYAFVADGTSGLRIIDISNSAAPALVTAFDTPGDGLGLTVAGGYAYVADGNYGLRVINIQNPSAPFEAGYLDTPGYSWNVAVAGNYAYVADSHAGLRIVDVSNPATPTEVGSYLPPCCTREVAVAGHFVYMATAESGLRIIDVSNPAAPGEVGYYDTPGPAIGITVVNHMAYVADFYQFGIYDCVDATIACPPTPVPFAENFDNISLDTCWSWVRQDPTHWSLTERPGWMRLQSIPGDVDWYVETMKNRLYKRVSDTNFRIETKLEFTPVADNSAAIFAGLDETNFICVARQTYGGIRAHVFDNNWNTAYVDLAENWNPVHLRIEKVGDRYSTYASPDSSIWHHVATWQRNFAANGTLSVGIYSYRYSESPQLPADFDYFRVDPLPGTNVCGDISGVWNSTGSPYYVNCDVTVPAGQTLEIRPGVQVLFTGHYKFNVFGNLQAIGTEQDSIVFSADTLSNPNRWDGIKFIGQACSNSRFYYCCVENGLAISDDSHEGAGILCSDNASPTFTHCALRNNRARWGGGANVNGGGAPSFGFCSFFNNSAEACGGGIALSNSGLVSIDHCTFVGNSGETWNQGSVCIYLSSAIISNSIVASSPDYGVVFESSPNSILQYCDISGNALGNIRLWTGPQDGPPNLGVISSINVNGSPCDQYQNIYLDPVFIEALSNDFHLQATSPCIDAGDPNSPLDPDSTRADMGAFPYARQSLIVSPLELPFGLLDLGTDSTMHISLHNPLGWPIPILSIYHDVRAFSLDTTGLNDHIGAFATFSLPITFSPTAAGSYSDTLTITAQQEGDTAIRIPLSGSADVILPPVDSLVVRKGPSNGMRLDWAPITHSISGHPVQNILYAIYGSTSYDGPFVPFGYSTTNSYIHPYILNGQTSYFYRVTAEVGESLKRTKQP